MIKIIFLDWNKTLSDTIFWKQMKDASHPYHDFLAKIEQFLFKENYYLIDRWMLGKESSESICRKIAKTVDLDFEVIFEELVKSTKEMEFVDQKVPELVGKIKNKGIGVVVATDNMDTFRRFTIPGMGLQKVFDDFLLSFERECYKYDIKGTRLPFFDNYLKKKKLNYWEVVLIDDSLEKSGIFEKLGFKIEYVGKKNSLVDLLTKYAT